MADSSFKTRRSQWKMYLKFCTEFELRALPASLDTILLYIAYLAERLKYVSIINYLSAVWSFHKINGVPHIDPSRFEIEMTLKGVRRTLGDCTKQAPPCAVSELCCIYHSLDMTNCEDVAYWVALLLGFRGLLRKSNIVEEELAIGLEDVRFHVWGMTVRVRRTKTILYKERELIIPFTIIPGSIYCVYKHTKDLMSMCSYSSANSQLVCYMKRGRLVRGTYSWLSGRLRLSCDVLGLTRLTTHSLRRGGATAMSEANLTLLQIRDIGDWKSMAVLLYLQRSMQSRINLDREVVRKLFT